NLRTTPAVDVADHEQALASRLRDGVRDVAAQETNRDTRHGARTLLRAQKEIRGPAVLEQPPLGPEAGRVGVLGFEIPGDDQALRADTRSELRDERGRDVGDSGIRLGKRVRESVGRAYLHGGVVHASISR